MTQSLNAASGALLRALKDPSVLNTISGSDFSSISNNVMSACNSEFIAQTTRDQQIKAANSDKIGVMGLKNLVLHQTTDFIPQRSNLNMVFFRTNSVKCAMLLSRLQDPTLDDRLITYKGLFELELGTMRALKQFIPGLTLAMARSALSSFDSDRRDKTALVIDAFPGDTWGDDVAICSSLFLAVTNNINSDPDQWSPAGYDFLKDKIVPMFECLKPAFLERFYYNQLWPMVNELSVIDFSWQRGSAIVKKIFEDTDYRKFDTQFFQTMNRLNKYLTVDLLMEKSSNELFLNSLLSKGSLVAISMQTNDPLLLEWLYSEVRRYHYPHDLRDYTDENDVYTLGTLVAAMTVADIGRFDPQSIYQFCQAFQSKGLRPGQTFTLANRYLDVRNSLTSEPLTASDLTNLEKLLPAVDYKEIERIRVDDINLAMDMLQMLADRSRNEHPLTSAQRHLIAAKVTAAGENSKQFQIESLGPQLAMELSPVVYRTDLQALSDLGLEEVNGLLQPNALFLTERWTPYQKTVFYELFRREAGQTVKLTERMMYSLSTLAAGITTSDIFQSDFTNVIGITGAVMSNGGDMNKAWLLSLQIRRAFTAMYGLESMDQFSLALLGTANIAALDGLTLRMFSVKEMEELNAADCQDVISRIGNLDVYLLPFPKRRELVCFYVERCRYHAFNDDSILSNYQHTDPRIRVRGAKYYRKVANYCDAMTPVTLDNEDFEILGNLVCDIPAVLLARENLPNDIMWMFHHCKSLDLDQGAALFSQLRSVAENFC
jgi:hypothetical protein